jgi:uncharacterized integral membrane protein
MRPKLIAAVTGLVLVLIVVFQNTAVVSVRLLFWRIDMSLVILVLLSLLVGMLIGLIASRQTQKQTQKPK